VARYYFIAGHRAQWTVKEMCRVLKVSRGGFYDWQRRSISPRALQTQLLDAAIKELFEASTKRSGSPKITRALRSDPTPICESVAAGCIWWSSSTCIRDVWSAGH